MKVSNPTIIPRIKTAPRFGTLDINNIYTGPDNKATGIGVKRLKKGIKPMGAPTKIPTIKNNALKMPIVIRSLAVNPFLEISSDIF
jgi:hypothetical protein